MSDKVIITCAVTGSIHTPTMSPNLDEELVYIALSTQESTNVMLYPDSGKYGVWHGKIGAEDDPNKFLLFSRKGTAVDYWDGEGD